MNCVCTKMLVYRDINTTTNVNYNYEGDERNNIKCGTFNLLTAFYGIFRFPNSALIDGVDSLASKCKSYR